MPVAPFLVLALGVLSPTAAPERLAIVGVHAEMEDVVGVIEHQARESGRFEILPRDVVRAALAEFAQNGSARCVLTDALCWTKLAIGADFDVIAVVEVDDEALTVALVDTNGQRGLVRRKIAVDRVLDAREAWRELVDGPAPPPLSVVPLGEASDAMRGPDVAAPTDSGRSAWLVVAGVGAIALIGCTAGALFVDATMTSQQTDALAGTPLPQSAYDLEEGAFWLLATGAAAGLGIGSTGIAGWALADGT